MTHFRVERQTDIPLEFTGELLADVNSRDEPDQPRWQEIRIYKTDSGKYVTEVVGQTIVPDERVFITVNVLDNAADVRQALKRRKAGREFLNDMAFDALDEAGRHDPAIRESTIAERI